MRAVPAGSMIRTGVDEMARSLDCLAAGVAVIAVRGARGMPKSLVAASFNSVSLEPPILAWCAPAAVMRELGIAEDSACGVSILAGHQAHFSGLCAEPRQGDGPEALWEYGACLGVPLIARAAASFEVVLTRCLPQGANLLCLAQVARFGYQPCDAGLLRFAGRTAPVRALA